MLKIWGGNREKANEFCLLLSFLFVNAGRVYSSYTADVRLWHYRLRPQSYLRVPIYRSGKDRQLSWLLPLSTQAKLKKTSVDGTTIIGQVKLRVMVLSTVGYPSFITTDSMDLYAVRISLSHVIYMRHCIRLYLQFTSHNFFILDRVHFMLFIKFDFYFFLVNIQSTAKCN